MERIDLGNIEEILGIQAPWHISSVHFDPSRHIANIHIDNNDKKKLFGFIDSHKSDDVAKHKGQWIYLPLGTYKCVIHAEVASAGSEAISLSSLNSPAFLGNPNRNYSNQLLQQVALANISGMNENLICSALRVPPELVQQIMTDIEKASNQVRSLVYLPAEGALVWRKVLNDQLLVRTNLLPLKLLLSKLKLAAAKSSSDEELVELSSKLRSFFVANVNQLDDEINQLCGLNSDKLKRQASASKQRQRLVLPALKNPVWIDLLTGKLSLNSQSVPLNLLISRQRIAFLQGKDSATRIAAIETLREYVKRNHRSLKPELVLINRAMAINEKTQIRLPNPDHDIWQRILANDTAIPSDHVAYKLLLAKLRMQVQSSQDPVVKLEAARSIRNFMQQNQKALQRELSAIVKQASAN
ncbi:hypothetical protein [Agaribacterium haliotis]|uniref:hypothetical protein n=1 Tax=Agaribacterium haliotis TaxID=2013869 RepID=UPI000BB59D83|nr:hypothetical protein [Agaribacterium haliotis]